MIQREGLRIKQSFTPDFVSIIEALKKNYPSDIFKIQGISEEDMDISIFSKNFFGKSASASVADVSVDGNSNVNEKNITQYNYEINKSLMRLNSLYQMYKWIKKLYDKESAAEALIKVITGELFINDLVNFSMPYCYAFDLREMLCEGASYYKSNMKIRAPKRSDSFLSLVIQSTAYISNQILGACSYPDFFVALDYFYRKEHGEDYAKNLRTDKELHYKIKNQFQNLVYSLNFPFRGNQSAFTNLSVMDKGFLAELFDNYTYPDFTTPNLDSVLELSKVFFEYFSEINGSEGIFTFPVMTMAISLDDDGNYIDPEFVDWVAKTNNSKSVANIFQSKPNSFSSCCRLKNEFDKVSDTGYQNSFGVGGLSIGSHRVAGINLPRVAKLLKNDPSIIERDLELVHKILRAHRELLKEKVSRGMLPLYSSNWIHLSRQYSTVGFVGAYEYLENLGMSIQTEEGVDELVRILKITENKISDWQVAEKDQRNIYNIEQIPAESMAVRLAELDRILGFNDRFVLYSNQYIPLIEDASIYERFKIQGKIDALTSGGAILHINVDDEKPLSPEQFKKIILTAKSTGTAYFAVNYAYSECVNDHLTVGKHDKCPICDKNIVRQYTRVVGFITPVNSWNKVRREYEYDRRVFHSNDRFMKDLSTETSTVSTSV